MKPGFICKWTCFQLMWWLRQDPSLILAPFIWISEHLCKSFWLVSSDMASQDPQACNIYMIIDYSVNWLDKLRSALYFADYKSFWTQLPGRMNDCSPSFVRPETCQRCFNILCAYVMETKLKLKQATLVKQAMHN